MTEKVTFGEATSNTWSRPAGVGLLDLFGRAGKGGNESIGAGGSPAAFTVRGLDTVENTLYFYVGGDGDDGIFSGGSGAGGFNGGGNSPGSTQGAGGGGATDVRVGGTALGNRIFVAGGGGGAGSNNAGGGGGADGASGASGSGPTEANGGGGGSQSAGGAGGSGGGNGNNGSAGTLGSGGSGGSSGGLNRSGGGGGGGYYGGGGGEASDTSNESQAAGGGGGSSFIDTGQTYTSGSASLSSGTPTGTIEYSLPPQAPTLTDPPTGTRATPYSDSDPFPLNFTHNPTAGSEGVKTGAGAANDDQSAWAMRRRADGGAWEYWNGTSWVGSYTQVEETTDGSKDVGGVWQGDTTYGYEVGTASYGGTVTNWSAEQEVTFPPLVDGGSVTMPGVGAQDNIDVSAQLNTKVSYTLATNNGVNSPLYEVPPGVNRIYVEMRGSAGESVSGGFGGLGGYFSFAYDVTPGDFVYFRMEGPGSGGNGGSGAGGGDDGGDGGGAVRFDDDPLLFSSPIALAAGGGGAAVGRDGGDVLGPTGENGQDSGAGGGFGASAGSGAGGDAGPNNNNGNSGSTHNGGTAGDGSLAGDSDGGGGGGDGWRSGGGGASGHAGGAGRNGHDGSLGTIIYDTSWKNMGLGESTTAAVVRVVHLAPPLPEQMDGAGTLTATCEVFSFGVPQPQGGVGTQTTDGEVIRIVEGTPEVLAGVAAVEAEKAVLGLTVFEPTNVVQKFTWPKGATQVIFQLKGSDGAEAENGTDGGEGGYVEVIFNDRPDGTVYDIYAHPQGVGRIPTNYGNGGLPGRGGAGDTASDPAGGEGGHFANVRLEGDNESQSLLMAGGGGGGAEFRPGGDGGGDTADGGSIVGNGGGGGGSQTQAGAGGDSGAVNENDGQPGNLEDGGDGGDGHPIGNDAGGGGGGAGWYGGGGGASGHGGGGGSSFIDGFTYIDTRRNQVGFPTELHSVATRHGISLVDGFVVAWDNAPVDIEEAGVGTVVATLVKKNFGDASASGTGALTCDGLAIAFNEAEEMAGAGAQTADPLNTVLADATLAGTSTLPDVEGVLNIVKADATIPATGAQTAAGDVDYIVAPFTLGGASTATATPFSTFVIDDELPPIPATGTTSATATQTFFADATLAGAGAEDFDGGVLVLGEVVAAQGSGIQASEGLGVAFGTATLGGTSTTTAQPLVTYLGEHISFNDSTATISAVVIDLGESTQAATSTLDGTGLLIQVGTPPQQDGNGAVTPTALVTAFGDLTAAGAGAQTSDGEATAFGEATLPGVGDIVAEPDLTVTIDTAAGALTATATQTFFNVITVSSDGSAVTATGELTITGVVDADGTGDLQVNEVEQTVLASATLAGVATLTSDGTAAKTGQATMAGTSTLPQVDSEVNKVAIVFTMRGEGALVADAAPPNFNIELGVIARGVATDVSVTVSSYGPAVSGWVIGRVRVE